MHRTIVLVIIIISALNLTFGQNAFRAVSSNFKNNDQFFISELSKKTIQLYLKDKEHNIEVGEVIKSVENLKVVSFATKTEKDISKFLALIEDHYSLMNYTPFKVNTFGINNQLIYLKEQNNKISDLLIINTNYAQITLVEIIGDLDIGKIALLKNALEIDGLESLSSISKADFSNEGSVSVYNKSGSKMIETQNSPSLLINGYQPGKDFHSTLSEINPNCIQSINVTKENIGIYPNGLIDVMLKGDANNLFTVCEGMLYFGQNGFLQSIVIDDDCSPGLLFNCKQKPLSHILQMEPDKIKSIELTSTPRNCEGPLEGEYIVVESK